MQLSIVRLFFAALALLQPTDCKLVCDIEEYVRTGMEFVRCQTMTLKSFHENRKKGEGDDHEVADPCPALRKIIDSCVNVVRPCYDHHGFVRGRHVRELSE